jgi:hypothetical protein
MITGPIPFEARSKIAPWIPPNRVGKYLLGNDAAKPLKVTTRLLKKGFVWLHRATGKGNVHRWRFSPLRTPGLVISRNPQMHFTSITVSDPYGMRSGLTDRCK